MIDWKFPNKADTFANIRFIYHSPIDVDQALETGIVLYSLCLATNKVDKALQVSGHIKAKHFVG